MTKVSKTSVERLRDGHVADSLDQYTVRLLAGSLGIPLTQVCYVGDDVPDLPAMELAGLSAAPADASPPVRARAAIRL